MRADSVEDFKISSYGSFFHTEMVPNALFFFQKIEKNDGFELRRALRNHDVDSIILASPGGSVFEGLNMAGIIFDKELATYIPKNSICASACSFMFFAGRQRASDGNLGVHQFFSEDGQSKREIAQTQEIAQYTVAEIIGYLNEFGTPPFVYERMFQQSEMYFFKENELSQIMTLDQKRIEEKIPEIEKFFQEYALAKEQKSSTKSNVKNDELQPAPIKVETKKPEEPNRITEKTETRKTTHETEDLGILVQVQDALNNLGCNAGRADGILGKKTRAALKRYALEINQNLEASVLTDPDFLKELKRSSIKCKKAKPIKKGGTVVWVMNGTCPTSGLRQPKGKVQYFLRGKILANGNHEVTRFDDKTRYSTHILRMETKPQKVNFMDFGRLFLVGPSDGVSTVIMSDSLDRFTATGEHCSFSAFLQK